jgi:ribosomal protein L37E
MKCERCGGLVASDGEEMVCLCCGHRPLGFTDRTYNWQGDTLGAFVEAEAEPAIEPIIELQMSRGGGGRYSR